MDAATTADLWIKGLGAFFGAGAGVAAAMTYQRNARTKAAEFLLGLHKAFFIDTTYQAIKALLDCRGTAEEAKLAQAVAAETAEFTDFLNFFELIAYLTEIKTLTCDDAEALLGYYFDLLRETPVVYGYIKQKSNGFENLSRLLVERTQS